MEDHYFFERTFKYLQNCVCKLSIKLQHRGEEKLYNTICLVSLDHRSRKTIETMIGDVIDTLSKLHQLSIKGSFESQIETSTCHTISFKKLICNSCLFSGYAPFAAQAQCSGSLHSEKHENEHVDATLCHSKNRYINHFFSSNAILLFNV